MKNIGIVGLGVMGGGIARNLLAKGFALTVYARDAAKAQPFVALGAKLAADPGSLGECEAVVLSVSATQDVEDVVAAITAAPRSLRYVIDTSTISAQASRAIAQRLAAQGIAFLDAPVSGGRKGAEEGTLACMVGGTQEAFDACRDVFAAFAKSITRVGESGAGQVCKACNQVAVIANMLGVAEIVALCRSNGIDPLAVRGVLLASTGRSFVLECHALRVLDGNFEPAGFRADLMLKDLRLALQLEQEGGLPAHVLKAAEPLLERVVREKGGAVDWTAVGTVL